MSQSALVGGWVRRTRPSPRDTRLSSPNPSRLEFEQGGGDMRVRRSILTGVVVGGIALAAAGCSSSGSGAKVTRTPNSIVLVWA